jgi:micrococcal nuclease
MNKITRAISEARSRLTYSQPVYIPGYTHSPWKKWVILGVLISLLIVTAFLFLSDRSNGQDSKKSGSQSSGVSESAHVDKTQSTPESTTYYTVNRVIDGDTIDVAINGTVERIRLIGVDTPESVDPRKPVQCFGLEASNYVKSVLNGKKVALGSDSSQGDKDKYDRLLRYVYLVDGTNLDKELIMKGYGREYTYDLAYKHQNQFKEAQQIAQASKMGLWAPSACNGNT